MNIFKISQRVEGGDNAEDYDTGRIEEISGDQITVSWDSGVATTQSASLLRPLGASVEICEHEWHRFGTVNGASDVGCQKCGATQNA